ncbi:MAG: bifunctional DNA primase/polymerase, partial [Rhodobacteraceae bacterium]|nr:bifunctional DNA primase/polymerase [Paracoccaceae bacterium]
MLEAFRFEGDMLSSSIIKAALAWARYGGKIVALHGIDEDGQCTCGRADCKSPGKHPIAELFPKGQHSATSNADKIRRAFKKYPNANFGVILPPGVVVLDVDGPEGAETFKKLNLPPTLSVRTGRGTHHYFHSSEALPKKKASLPGIDIKDNSSGYLVGPPSMHKCGRRYRVQRGEVRLAALPADFLRTLKRDKSRTANFDTVGAFKAGSRNNELTKIAGSLRFAGLAETAIAGALQAINSAACS